MRAATSMKYAGKVDIARNVNSVLNFGGSNKNVQPMDYTGDRTESLTRIGRPIKANQEITVCKTKA